MKLLFNPNEMTFFNKNSMSKEDLYTVAASRMINFHSALIDFQDTFHDKMRSVNDIREEARLFSIQSVEAKINKASSAKEKDSWNGIKIALNKFRI